MKIVLLGPPGAGKGTVAVKLKEHLGIPHISTGDLFRYNISNQTELGKQVKMILDKGDLVPDSITVEMVRQRLQNEDCKPGFILDGFPRTVAQADFLATMTDIDCVVYFDIREEEVVKRLSGRRMCKSSGRLYHIIFNPPKVEGRDDETGEILIQRDDDKPQAISNRIKVYNDLTMPLVNYYREKSLLRNVDANFAPQEVFLSVLDELKLVGSQKNN